MRLIDADVLTTHIEEEHRRWGEDYDALQILGDIEDAPTIEPCEDAISREDAIRAMEQRYEDILRIYKRKVKLGEKAIALDMIGCVKTLPSVAPSRPSGEWITEEKGSIYGKKIRLTCSECGDVFDVTEAAFPYERYCRYCGAKMKGADNE